MAGRRREVELASLTDDLNGIFTSRNEGLDGHKPEKRVVAFVIALTLPPLLFWRKDVGDLAGHLLERSAAFLAFGRVRRVDTDNAVLGFKLFEDEDGIQHLGIDFLRCQISCADNEDFGRNVSRGRWLGGFDALKELVEDPEERVVVFRAEDLGDKSGAGC